MTASAYTAAVGAVYEKSFPRCADMGTVIIVVVMFSVKNE
jgi:hypothetical protein